MSGTVPGSVQADVAARIRLLLNTTIVTAGGRDWTGRDLVTAGALSRRWCRLEADLARSLVSLESWTPPQELVREALREFRYARRLISADDFVDWLRKRGLTQQELKDAIERRLAREHDDRDARARDSIEPRTGAPAALRHRALAALPAEAVYTGALLDCAEWLIDRILCLPDARTHEFAAAELELLLERERELMVFEVVGESDGDRRARAELLLAASAAHDARVADVCSAQAISKLLQRRALDWLRFDLVGFVCPAAGTAAEIAALLREGTPPELITEVSSVPAEQSRLYLEEAPAAIQGWLGGAVPGTVIGPVVEQDTHRTWLVRARQAPNSGDPSIAGKARMQIVGEYMRRRRAGKVKWHERY